MIDRRSLLSRLAGAAVALPLLAGPSQAGGRIRDVLIKDGKFVPATLRIAPGDIVVFSNRDDTEHTVSSDNRMFDTGPVRPGESIRIGFPDAGQHRYHCRLHPRMKGRIIVG